MNEKFEHHPGFQEGDSICALKKYNMSAEMSWVCSAVCNRAANGTVPRAPATCGVGILEMDKQVKVQWVLLYSAED